MSLVNLRPLEVAEYRAAFELQPAGVMPFEDYALLLSSPTYLNFAILADGRMVAVLSLEKTAPGTVRFHVSKEARGISPPSLVFLLRTVAGFLFENGTDLCEVVIPPDRRAAARLALRCGMREVASGVDRVFHFTSEDLYGQLESESNADAV